MNITELVCDARAAACRCGLPPNHDGPHECSGAFCEGSWSGTFGGDDFQIVRYPINPSLLLGNGSLPTGIRDTP
jgi:hypothetical protein